MPLLLVSVAVRPSLLPSAIRSVDNCWPTVNCSAAIGSSGGNSGSSGSVSADCGEAPPPGGLSSSLPSTASTEAFAGRCCLADRSPLLPPPLPTSSRFPLFAAPLPQPISNRHHSATAAAAAAAVAAAELALLANNGNGAV